MLLVIAGVVAIVHAVESGSSPKVSTQSACLIYYRDHDAKIEFTGREASAQCDRFLRHHPEEENEERDWTKTAPQTGGKPKSVCRMANSRNEHVVVMDTGGAYYGGIACRVLWHQNWRRIKGDAEGSPGALG